jgi:hypothetical protein
MDIPGLVNFFFNSPGPGGAVVVIVLGGALLVYARLGRWILFGNDRDRDPER